MVPVSALSVPDFFSSRVMDAALKTVDTTPSARELLKISTKKGVGKSALFLRSQFGSVSVAHCLPYNYWHAMT